MIAYVAYWFKLNDEVSMYITMFYLTLRDMIYFLILLVLSITSFSVAVYILDNKTRQLAHDSLDIEYEFMTEDMFTLGEYTNRWFDEYLLMLGEFGVFTADDSDKYQQHGDTSRNFLWLYFGLATLISQVIMLNILIAIVNDSYAKIMEFKKLYRLQQRTKMYNDYVFTLKIDEKFTKLLFIYIIKPEKEEIDEGEWDHALKSLKNTVEDTRRDLHEEIHSINKKQRVMQ